MPHNFGPTSLHPPARPEPHVEAWYQPQLTCVGSLWLSQKVPGPASNLRRGQTTSRRLCNCKGTPRTSSPPRRTRHIMFRTRLRIPRQGLSLGLRTTVNARRSLHQVPSLPHDYSQGIPNLMSPGGFAVAWTDYMSLMVEKLNALTTGKFCSSSLPLRNGFALATAARSCSPIAQAPQLTAFHL